MIYDYLKSNNIDNIGYVVILGDIPHLFISSKDKIFIDGIPLLDDEGMYDGLDYNDIILVGVNVLENSKHINPLDIDDDNRDEFIYKIVPLYIYTIKTQGLIAEDVLDLDFLDLLFDKIIKLYEDEKLI